MKRRVPQAPRPRTRPPRRKVEGAIEQGGGGLLVTAGFREIRISQARPTMQTPGIPDRRYVHRALGLALWWEAKAPGRKQSPAQREFELDCLATGELYLLGGKDTLRAALTVLGCYDQATGLVLPSGWRRRWPNGLTTHERDDLQHRLRVAVQEIETPYRMPGT